MSESAPDDSELSTIIIHGKSAEEWHRWLITDQKTGESHADAVVPCSRYGSNGEEGAYWALACELIYCEANGDNSDEDPHEALDWYMSLAVNDHQDVLDLVLNYWYAVPDALKPYLDYEDNGLNMNQQAALSGLCGRYSVEYKAENYHMRSDLPDGYKAGWCGPIYVGCDLDGRISS